MNFIKDSCRWSIASHKIKAPIYFEIQFCLNYYALFPIDRLFDLIVVNFWRLLYIELYYLNLFEPINSEDFMFRLIFSTFCFITNTILNFDNRIIYTSYHKVVFIFSKDKRSKKTTIVPLSQSAKIGQRNMLSKTDCMKVNQAFGCFDPMKDWNNKKIQILCGLLGY